ncbi:thiol peroxidase [Hypnocyclicus thermotrophus]|uniref:Thiol peroxidase n=1 Tax=Hypnocyclicus thermotrophus TaxID=1627895 RepID=A0AA46E037_9FUSO|nr:thiol peroxidase [Hypnocyclicus thermotrophus]TDT72231.1 thiol peroxidase [Hypnocyclicus thermotrophus]
MTERKNEVTFGGAVVTLLGNKINIGDKAPDFVALKNDLSELRLSELEGVKLISVVPSIDTGVCELQTTRFNQEAGNLKGVNVITISVDLPFALDRFCANKGIDKAVTLSDHRDLDFGTKYGFAIKEHRLLSRGIVLVDADNIVRYVEYVSEVTNHPDYDKALAATRELLK